MLNSNPPRTGIEKALEIASIVILLAGVLYLILDWGNIPDRVPGHYNFTGEVDRWDSKGSLFVLPGAAFFLYALLSLITLIPYKPKKDGKMSPERSLAVWRNSRLLLTALKAEIVAIFIYLEWQTIEVARGNASSLGGGFLPVYLVIIFGTLTYFLLRQRRIK